MLRKKVTRHDSSHNQRLQTRVRVIFTKSLSLSITHPIRLHTKKWAFFALVMIKICTDFLLCLSSRAILHFEHQVSPSCTALDLRLCFHWRESRAQYIDSLSWFIAFAYRDRNHDSGTHTVTLSLCQIPVKRFKLFRFETNPKIILQNIMQIRKPNHVEIQIPVTVISVSPCGDVFIPHTTLNS